MFLMVPGAKAPSQPIAYSRRTSFARGFLVLPAPSDLLIRAVNEAASGDGAVSLNVQSKYGREYREYMSATE